MGFYVLKHVVSRVCYLYLCGVIENNNNMTKIISQQSEAEIAKEIYQKVHELNELIREYQSAPMQDGGVMNIYVSPINEYLRVKGGSFANQITLVNCIVRKVFTAK